MKKSLFFAAMACIAFAGCTEDEVTTGNSNQEREICFTSPYVGKTTRTVYQEMDNPYATTENFNVFGVWHTGTFAGWSTASLYMNDAETAYDDITEVLSTVRRLSSMVRCKSISIITTILMFGKEE